MSKDLYNILDVSKNVSEHDLKKAYKKMALRHHPDRNKDKEEAEKKFKEVSEAYEILNNPKKRDIYDKFGYDALKEMNDSGNSQQQHHDIFEHMFGSRQNREEKKETDIIAMIGIDLVDSYTGKKLKKDYQYNKRCTICSGKGLKKNASSKVCSDCNGNGMTIRMMRMGPIAQQVQSECNRCNGKGNIFNKNDICKGCNMKKFVVENDEVELDITRGIKSDDKLIFYNKGHEDKEGNRGDMVLIVKIEENEKYRINGDDIYIDDVDINLYECLVGTAITIDFIDNKERHIKIDDIISPNKSYKVNGLGMPVKNMIEIFGDLYISFNINFPDVIEYNEDNIHLLSKILKQKNRNVDETEVIYNLTSDCKGQNSYESDEDEHQHPNGQRMECNQQ